ncbi:MAG: helix-turn-helix domain-containing protein [Coriobacteriia bacterium]|nr:helix-turn-helix domain-containing protein [Coriobacteriia bacterium]
MDVSIQEKVGKRIRQLRNENTGLSQEKFAHIIGMDRTYFSSIELGRHSVTVSKLEVIAVGLGVSLEELFRGM